MKKSFLYKVFSEKGQYPSSKRVVGAFMIFVIMVCTTIAICKEGMTHYNKDVIEVEVITAGALLGVSTVTRIWNKNSNNDDGRKSDEEE